MSLFSSIFVLIIAESYSIYHMNIACGFICADMLYKSRRINEGYKHAWTYILTLEKVAIALVSFLGDPNPGAYSHITSIHFK
jgi:ubiquitin-protein ligase